MVTLVFPQFTAGTYDALLPQRARAVADGVIEGGPGQGDVVHNFVHHLHWVLQIKLYAHYI